MLALIDARRGEASRRSSTRHGAPLWEPCVDRSGGARANALAERSARRRWRRATARYDFASQLESAGVEVLPDADPAHRMAARHICALAATIGAGAGRATSNRPI